MTEAELLDLLVDRVTRLLPASDGAPIDVDAPLDALGLSSRDAVTLAGELEDVLDRSIAPTVAWEEPSVRRLARRLADAPAPEPEPEPEPAAAVPSPAGAHDEPLAVVGIGCRFPGGVAGPDDYWSLLLDGGDAIGDVPTGRWAASGVDVPDGTVTLRGGFLDDVEGFDAEFFGITPTEAELVDPQQRLLLEVAVDALRHARIDPAALRGSDTGVFVGISSSEYGHLTAARVDDVGPWTATGAAPSIAAGRLSYCLDLQGPSVAVDTACSSSLVAVHQAAAALRADECSLALVGGVNLLLTPLVTAAFERAGALAPDGRCKSFSADADGIGRGEGCGVVVLERLADARAHGHRVLAVVHGSGVNSDGRSNGLTAPNPSAQEALLRRTYTRLGIDPADVDYVEAHGTGTLLGDPIEAAALGRVLGAGRAADRPLLLGSAKSNLGHLEAAAGIAGVIKVVLAMAHDRLPATLHAAQPNPRIAFERDRLALVGAARSWPRHSGAALAGVSGFGFGGTNAHVVLGQAPADVAAPTAVPAAPDASSEVQVLAVSASTPARARDAAHALADWLTTDAGRNVALCTIARSSAARPDDARARIVVAARDHADAAQSLLGAEPQAALAAVTRPVWVFSGYGQQWAGMGSRLAREEPVFSAALDEVGVALDGHVDVDVVSIVRSGTTPAGLAATMVTVFAVQIALAALWRSEGVEPAAVIGHSMGEVAAAVVAGGLTLADGAEVMAVRSRLLAGVDDGGAGAMALLDLRPDEIGQLSARWPGVEVAVFASPTQVTVAGPAEQVRLLIDHVESDGRDAWPLAVRGAGHSAAVEPVLPALREQLSGVRGHRPDVRVYGTVLDDPRAVPAFDADYWVANARRPVHFRQAVAAAVEDGHDTFVEIAAHPVSSRAVRATLDTLGRAGTVVASLRRDGDDTLELARNLAALRAAGHPTAAAVHRPDGPVVDLPHAPWRHRPYWFRPTAGPPSRGSVARADLGHATDLPAGLGRIWTADDAHPVLSGPLTLAAVADLATVAVGEVLGHGELDVTAATLDHARPAGVAVSLVSCTRTAPGHLDVEVFVGTLDRVRVGHARVTDRTAGTVPAGAPALPAAVPVGDDTPPGAALAYGAEPGRAQAAVQDALRATLADIMGHHPDDLALDVPLTDLGFDSLMATRARTAVERDFGVPLPVRLLLQGLTLDGLAGYVTAELGCAADETDEPVPTAPVLHRVPPRDPTERFLAGLWADAAAESGDTGEAPGMTAPLAGHTLTVVRMRTGLVDRLGHAPAFDDLMAAGTLEAMADLVRDAFESSGPNVVRTLRGPGNRRPLFVFHPAGGPTSVYRPLVDLLPADLPVYGMERLDDLDSVEAKATRYVELVRGVQPSGPYRLMGWSLGGVLAGECAQQLRAAGDEVEFLASIDTILPLEDVTVDTGALLVERYRRFAAYVSETYGATMVVPDDIGEHDELTQMGLLHGALTEAGVVLPAGVLRHQYTSYVDARIAERYEPRPWDGRMVLYRAQEVEGLTTGLDPRYLRHDETLGWDATVADLVVVRVPGHHISMIDRPHVDVLARDLTARLAALDTRTRFDARPSRFADPAGAR